MRARPAALDHAIGWLFVIGSSLFVLGSVPSYANAVGGPLDSVTYFVGSLFFTSASFLQLLQAQTPAMTEADASTQHTRAPLKLWAWMPHDKGWIAAATQFPGTLFFNVSTAVAIVSNLTTKQQDQHVWRPDFFGSTLFLVSSFFALLAVRSVADDRVRVWMWGMAWANMIGSIFFMASAFGSFVLPKTGDLVDVPLTVGGTLVGAACFLLGALMMFPAWQLSVTTASPGDASAQTP